MYDRVMEIYDWISVSCPAFVNFVSTVIFCAVVLFSIGSTYMLIIAIFGWHLITITCIALVLSLIIWLINVHRHYDNGIRSWWNLRPWR